MIWQLYDWPLYVMLIYDNNPRKLKSWIVGALVLVISWFMILPSSHITCPVLTKKLTKIGQMRFDQKTHTNSHITNMVYIYMFVWDCVHCDSSYTAWISFEQAVLHRTIHDYKVAGFDPKTSSLEIRLIQSQDDIRNPQVKFNADKYS